MNKLLTRILIIPFLLLCLPGISQTVIYSEDFNSTNTFILNDPDLNSFATENSWVVDNSYPGGPIFGDCPGFPGGSVFVSATPDQPGGITAGPQSSYMHIVSQFGLMSGTTNSNFIPAIPTCIPPGNSFAKMTSGVSTTGQGAIAFSFWWLCGGGPENFGEVYYSIDNGANWIIVPGSLQFFENPNWLNVSYTSPAFMNQTNLRFAFRFVNEGTAENLMSFAIDDVKITAAGEAAHAITAGAVLPGPYCAGADVQIPFSVTGTFTPGNVFTAEISDGVGGFSPMGALTGTGNGVINGIIPFGTDPGTYEIRIVSDQPAVTSSTVSVTVASAPEASISPTSSATVCDNGNATITYNGSPGNIQWFSSTDGVDFFPIDFQTGTVLTDGPLEVPMYYQAEVSTNCGSSTSAPWFVNVGTSAPLTITASSNSLNLCNGGNIQVSLSGTFSEIEWSNGQQDVYGITVNAPGDVFVNATDASGCEGTSSVLHFIQTIPATLTVTPASPVTLCGSPVTITASPGFAEYFWSTGENSSSIVISEIPSVPLTVSGIDDNGCLVAPISIQVILGTSTSIPVTPSVATVCDGQPALLSAQSGFTNYQWSNGASGQNISVSLTGYYSVTATDAGGCPATSPLIEVIQSQFPVPNFTYTQNAGGYTITFDNTSQNATEYSWYFDSLSTSPLENPAFTFPDNGPYQVTLIISNPCGTDSVTKLVLVAHVGFEDLISQHNINVYPNPSGGEFNVAINNSEIAEFKLDVFDVTGRSVYSSVQKFSGNKILNLPAGDIPSGIYLLRIQKDNASSVLKLIKE